MKSHLIMTVILFILMIFFPLVTLTDNSTASEKNTTTENITEKEPESSSVDTVTVLNQNTGKVSEMEVKDYVYSAVCAEMPASFHIEALKAQAVASYTYMKWLKENADNGEYISDSPSIHQALASEEELKKKWGSSYSVYSQKIREAVNDVLYEYLTYKGETAMTVFHGLSPGQTVSAERIWGTHIDYLQTVSAPGDSLSPDINTTVKLSKEDFLKPFNESDTNTVDEIIKSLKTDENGFITNAEYKSSTITSTDMRSAYKLKSPHFKAEFNSDTITLTVYGKGHGVGMSQYSADYMARQGSTYTEILAHFYKGTVLIKK